MLVFENPFFFSPINKLTFYLKTHSLLHLFFLCLIELFPHCFSEVLKSATCKKYIERAERNALLSSIISTTAIKWYCTKKTVSHFCHRWLNPAMCGVYVKAHSSDSWSLRLLLNMSCHHCSIFLKPQFLWHLLAPVQAIAPIPAEEWTTARRCDRYINLIIRKCVFGVKSMGRF